MQPCSTRARAERAGQLEAGWRCRTEAHRCTGQPDRRASGTQCAILVPIGPGRAQQSIVACSARARVHTRARARVRSIASRRHFSAGGRPICGAIVRRVRVRRVQHLPAGLLEDRLRGGVRRCGRRTRLGVHSHGEHRRLPERLLPYQRRRLLQRPPDGPTAGCHSAAVRRCARNRVLRACACACVRLCVHACVFPGGVCVCSCAFLCVRACFCACVRVRVMGSFLWLCFCVRVRLCGCGGGQRMGGGGGYCGCA
jgi:hypothetical protein